MPSTGHHRLPTNLSVLLLINLFSFLVFVSAFSHSEHVPLLSLPILSEKQTSPEEVSLPSSSGSPIASSTCGYARITQVGVTVNKGSKATLKYKIRVRAISAQTLAFSDAPFVEALSEPHLNRYKAMRDAYSGGLDIPFLQFLGVDLDNPSRRVETNSSVTDEEFRKLSQTAQGILTEATKQFIKIKGKLKAKGISCVTTTAFAFIKIAKVNISSGDQLTVLNTRDDDLIAATLHADTTLPSAGSVSVKQVQNNGTQITLLNPDDDFLVL